MLSNTLLVLVLYIFHCSAAQRIIYNKTFCSEDQSSLKLQSQLPQFPAYSMSISSSTYQAGKPISIEVKACENNGFRAFLLRASVEGYFLAMKNKRFKSTDFKLGTIRVACGVKKQTGDHVEYNNQSPNSILTFKWEPPLGTHGNITFHFTAVPKIPSVFWLKFKKSYKQGYENQIVVEQQCTSSSAADLRITFLWTVLLAVSSRLWSI